MIACAVRTLALVQLSLTPLILAGAWVNVRMARRSHRAADQYIAASHAASQLTSALVLRAGPWLECDSCGARLDPRHAQGLALELDDQGQLRLLCGDHARA